MLMRRVTTPTTKKTSTKEFHHAAALLVHAMGAGTKSRDFCPKCAGGASRERCFTVCRESPTFGWYRCHRASCGFHGATVVGAGESVQQPQPTKGKSSDYWRRIHGLPDDVECVLRERFGLTREELAKNRVGYNPETGRILYPVLDALGRRTGIIGRLYQPDGQSPKSLTFWEYENALRIYIPASCVRSADDTICLVEDPVSAIRVGRILPAGALLGVYLQPDTARRLSRAYRNLVVFLDPGAERAAFDIERNNRLLFRSIRVICGHALDPKDMDDETLARTLALPTTEESLRVTQ